MGERQLWVVIFSHFSRKPVIARDPFKDQGSLESTCKVLHAWVRAEHTGGSEAHSLLAELWGMVRPYLSLSFPPSVLPSLPPSIPPSLLPPSAWLPHTVSGSHFRVKPWAQARSCHGKHSWVCQHRLRIGPSSRVG